jgi:hypothetical protein
VPTPDAIEPITALRTWRVDADLNLHSLNDQMTWVPDEWMTAKCHLAEPRHANHRAPHEGCTCGLYALKDQEPSVGPGEPRSSLVVLAALTRISVRGEPSDGQPHPPAVMGRVHLAGKVIEHEDGYRAERARIVELLPLAGRSRGIESVARRYGVPVAEEITVPPLLDLDPQSLLIVHACHRSPTEPAEPSVIGRFWILAISLFAVINGLRGILWETHRLEWSDWWLCLIVLAGAFGIRRVILTFPRALRRWRHASPEVPTASPDDRPAAAPVRRRSS